MKSKNQNKKLPPELLIDIFKSTDSTIMKFTKKVFFNDDNIPLMLKGEEFKRFWISCVVNLLTSSSIVYIFVGKIFKKRLAEIPKLRKEMEEIYAVLLRLRGLKEILVESEELKEEFKKSINEEKKKIYAIKFNLTQNDIPLDIFNGLFNLIVELKIKENLEKINNYLNKEEGEEINTSTTVGGEE